MVWLFLNLGPTIIWNWKLKQWNIRRFLIILTLEPVAYNLRHFTCLFLSYGFVIRHGTAWYLMWPGYLSREEFNKKSYRTICVADHFTGFYMPRIFTERYFRTQAHVPESVFARYICISYRTVPSTIWLIFSEFFIFCRLISQAFRRVK